MLRRILSLVAIVAALPGCNVAIDTTPLAMLSEQQERFAQFLSSESAQFNLLNTQENKNDFCRSFERKAFGFFDSFGLLHQWCGTIVDVKRSENSFSLRIGFSIECQAKPDATMFFHCEYIISRDSLAIDPLFAKLDSLSPGSSVAFDAVAITRNNGTLKYHNGQPLEERNISAPHYRMHLIDIEEYSQTRAVPIFNDKQEAIVAAYALVEPDRLNYLGRLSDQGREARLSVAEQVYLDSLEPLEPSERRYVERLRRALTYNYRYGD